MTEEERKAYKKRWWLENRDRILPSKRIKSREHYRKNRKRILAQSKKYQQANLDRCRVIKYRWVEKNKERYRNIQKEWSAKKRQDPIYRLSKNLSIRITKALSRKGKKCSRTAEILGCSLDSFRIYMESKFEEGMTWENYGKVWHVDHIMPCAIFDLSKPDHQRRCFHFSNLQPLFAFDNKSKKDRVLEDHQFDLL